uniref:Transthyretin/hydroxyisourate hydrolase domain-containing protein n=1 Tax=Oncorhynchus tshawytscha TaxID=74940 RepID=A0AAZ3PUD1_ONCTS
MTLNDLEFCVLFEIGMREVLYQWQWFVVQNRHGESDAQCPLMVKILHAVKGVPAGSMARSVSRRETNGMIWAQVAINNLISEQDFQTGVYRGTTHFHNTVVFEVRAEGHRHNTLALLRSPFSYTTTAVVIIAHTPDQA